MLGLDDSPYSYEIRRDYEATMKDLSLRYSFGKEKKAGKQKRKIMYRKD